MAQHDITDLIARIEATGGTRDQLVDLGHDSIQWQPQYGELIAYNVRARDAAESYVEQMEATTAAAEARTSAGMAPAAGPLATDRQVDYAASLLARYGEEPPGWLLLSTVPNHQQLRAMTRTEISSLISGLSDSMGGY